MDSVASEISKAHITRLAPQECRLSRWQSSKNDSQLRHDGVPIDTGQESDHKHHTAKDLDLHASEIPACLKPDGVYYAAIGCHNDNLEWSRWRELMAPRSNLPVRS